MQAADYFTHTRHLDAIMQRKRQSTTRQNWTIELQAQSRKYKNEEMGENGFTTHS